MMKNETDQCVIGVFTEDRMTKEVVDLKKQGYCINRASFTFIQNCSDQDWIRHHFIPFVEHI